MLRLREGQGARNLVGAAGDRILVAVYSLLRPLISLAFLVGSLWFACSVKLGGRTFAEHVDRIGQTPEAHDLIEGTRATVNPVLQEATDRMLGEHIEAPTRAEPAKPEAAPPGRPGAHLPRDRSEVTHAAGARPRASTAEHVKLPGS